MQMTEEKVPRPANGELEILRVLWRKGPSTVRSVWEDLRRRRKIGYTTVLKQLQSMAAKGLVIRDPSQRAHLFYPRLTEEKTQQQLLGDLLRKAFGGSVETLVMQALSSRQMTAEELAEIQRLLDERKES
jgi:BlaI family penicillinase repressor